MDKSQDRSALEINGLHSIHWEPDVHAHVAWTRGAANIDLIGSVTGEISRSQQGARPGF